MICNLFYSPKWEKETSVKLVIGGLMPLLKILHSDEVKQYDLPPQFSAEERKSAFYLSTALQEALKKIHSPTNQVCFVLQYGYFKITHRFYSPQDFHQKDIDFVIRRLNLLAADILITDKYFRNKSAEHQQQICSLLGFHPWSSETKKQLVDEALFLSQKHISPRIMLGLLLDFLEEERIEKASYYTLQEVITDAINATKDQLEKTLLPLLSEANKKVLDDLLKEHDESHLSRSKLTLLRKINHSLQPKKIKENISDYTYLQGLYEQMLPIIKAVALPTETIRYFAEVAIKGQIPQISRRDESRYIYLFCFVIHQYFRLNDTLIDAFTQSCQNSINRSRQKYREDFYEEHKSQRMTFKESTSIALSSTEIVDRVTSVIQNKTVSEKERLQEVETIVSLYPLGEIQNTLSSLEKKTNKDERDFFAVLAESSLKLQNRVSPIVKELSFDEENSNRKLYDMISYYQRKAGKIGNDAPILFFDTDEQEALISEDGVIHISLYKVLLFRAMMDAIKSGLLNLKHSYKYRPFEHYLIEKERWLSERDTLIEKAGLGHLKDFQKIKEKLHTLLKKQYRKTNQTIKEKENPYLTIKKDGSYTIKTPKIETPNPQTISDMLPKDQVISLYEILSTISKMSPFLQSFLHWQIKNSKERPHDSLFFAGIMGYGCNIGINRIAKISQGINNNALGRVVTWYFSQENIENANNTILKLTEQLKVSLLAQEKADQTHTSSDGQKFNIAVDSLNASYSHKYFGTGKGVSVYTFIDESHKLFHSTVITPSEREAAYVIDGLLANEVVKSTIHSTDTHGYTEIIFGLSHLLGVSFAPRIKKVQNQILYSIYAPKEYKEEGDTILFTKSVQCDHIEKYWDDILRLLATIKLKKSSASQLLKRLSSYSKQHPLYKALNQFGRLIKSLFILTYFDDLDLRQSIEKQLNKIESANKFAKAVFYARNQEFYYATKEEQVIAEGCKRLIENAIICWNYLYISKKICNASTSEKKKELLEIAKYGSIVAWYHVNMQGIFDFSDKMLENSILFDLEEILKMDIAV